MIATEANKFRCFYKSRYKSLEMVLLANVPSMCKRFAFLLEVKLGLLSEQLLATLISKSQFVLSSPIEFVCQSNYPFGFKKITSNFPKPVACCLVHWLFTVCHMFIWVSDIAFKINDLNESCDIYSMMFQLVEVSNMKSHVKRKIISNYAEWERKKQMCIYLGLIWLGVMRGVYRCNWTLFVIPECNLYVRGKWFSMTTICKSISTSN